MIYFPYHRENCGLSLCPIFQLTWDSHVKLLTACSVPMLSWPEMGEDAVAQWTELRTGKQVSRAWPTNTCSIVSSLHWVMSNEVMEVICCSCHMAGEERGLLILYFPFTCFLPFGNSLIRMGWGLALLDSLNYFLGLFFNIRYTGIHFTVHCTWYIISYTVNNTFQHNKTFRSAFFNLISTDLHITNHKTG